jgi:hypothetical protein
MSGMCSSIKIAMQFWDEIIPCIIPSYSLALVLEDLVFEVVCVICGIPDKDGVCENGSQGKFIGINSIVFESLEFRATERQWFCWERYVAVWCK